MVPRRHASLLNPSPFILALALALALALTVTLALSLALALAPARAPALALALALHSHSHSSVEGFGRHAHARPIRAREGVGRHSSKQTPFYHLQVTEKLKAMHSNDPAWRTFDYSTKSGSDLGLSPLHLYKEA